jgi:hypothetical protein
VNTVMNLRLHEILGNSSASDRLFACQEGLRSVELVITLYRIYSNIEHNEIHNLIHFIMIDVYGNYLNTLFSLNIRVLVILNCHPFATFRWHTAYVSHFKFVNFFQMNTVPHVCAISRKIIHFPRLSNQYFSRLY